jgi:CDP-diacylglycerol--glycerol-3-phosphate 3-phosphatidyltransferase
MTSSAPLDGEAPVKRVSPLPNVLSWARIIAGPVIAGLILFADAQFFAAGRMAAAQIYLVAAVLFVLAALTDLIDGQIARKTGSVTAYGAALDHAADKVLTHCTLLALAVVILPRDLIAAAIILLARDLLAAGLREGLAPAGKALGVGGFGKWKTAAVMAGVGVVLIVQPLGLAAMYPDLIGPLVTTARALLWAGVALGLMGLWDLLRAAR